MNFALYIALFIFGLERSSGVLAELSHVLGRAGWCKHVPYLTQFNFTELDGVWYMQLANSNVYKEAVNRSGYSAHFSCTSSLMTILNKEIRQKVKTKLAVSIFYNEYRGRSDIPVFDTFMWKKNRFGNRESILGNSEDAVFLYTREINPPESIIKKATATIWTIFNPVRIKDKEKTGLIMTRIDQKDSNCEPRELTPESGKEMQNLIYKNIDAYYS